ncbi:MAG TPA: DUF4190 domain-containing protein [Verrucomicrobiae bacterium]|nr:DUF4190 domain-containing protein [Verrucomicrobiae bacterium]
MFCSNCGAINEGREAYCAKCGQALAIAPAAGPGEGATSGKAVASLICGILFFIFPSAVAAVILGHISHSEIRKSAGRLKGEGLAVAGLVLGYMGILIIPLTLIVAAIAIPNLLRSRLAANEARAVGALRTIETAEMTYSNQYKNGFSPTLRALDGADAGAPSCDYAELISSALASGWRSGYVIRYVPLAEDGSEVDPENRTASPAHGCSAAGAPRFKLTADPMKRGQTGNRSFYTDETGVIRWSADDPATADSPPLR